MGGSGRSELLRWTSVVGLAVALSSCGLRRYTQPTATEPHALVTVRLRYPERPGPELEHSVTLNGVVVEVGEPADDGGFTQTLRVRPEPLRWELSSTFFHFEEETRVETVQEVETYACGSAPRPQSRTCTREVPRHQWRTDRRRVEDGTCSASLVVFAEQGRRYVVEYAYAGGGECSARCLRRGASATAEEVPCR